MVMARDDHEAILNELLDENIEYSRKTELLNQLRNDYGSVIDEYNELTENNEKLQKDNSDLVVSNSKLFRELGDIHKSDEANEQEQRKEYSETVTIEDLEGDQ